MRLLPLLLIGCFVVLYVPTAYAQGTAVTGRVVDAKTGRPLPGVNVFLDQTMRGTATNAQGRYSLEKIPPGSYRVVASMVGFEVARELAETTPSRTQVEINFRLTPTVYVMPEVEVSEEPDRAWQKNLKRFEKLFLGASRNVGKTRIVDPYVLSFETTDDGFYARASETLEIENQALGYRLFFVLTNFFLDDHADLLHMNGPFRFEALEPEDEKEAERWEKNRQETFHGSLQHFLWSLVRRATFKQGYTIQIDDRPNAPYSQLTALLQSVEVDELLEPTDLAYLHRLRFSSHLFVRYRGEKSWINLNYLEAYLHENGYMYALPMTTGALTVHGAFAEHRIADLLPKEYPLDYERLNR